jgi:hypothetical protein
MLRLHRGTERSRAVLKRAERDPERRYASCMMMGGRGRWSPMVGELRSEGAAVRDSGGAEKRRNGGAAKRWCGGAAAIGWRWWREGGGE